MDFEGRKPAIKIVAAAGIAAFVAVVFLLYRADAPSCSNSDTVRAVIDLEKGILGTLPFYGDFFDFKNTDFALEEIRTEGTSGNKLECAAKLFGDPVQRDFGSATKKNDATVRQMFAPTFKAGIPVFYNLQNTDDGKLFVEIEKR